MYTGSMCTVAKICGVVLFTIMFGVESSTRFRFNDVCQQKHNIYIVLRLVSHFEIHQELQPLYETLNRDQQLKNGCNNITIVAMNYQCDVKMINIHSKYAERHLKEFICIATNTISDDDLIYMNWQTTYRENFLQTNLAKLIDQENGNQNRKTVLFVLTPKEKRISDMFQDTINALKKRSYNVLFGHDSYRDVIFGFDDNIDMNVHVAFKIPTFKCFNYGDNFEYKRLRNTITNHQHDFNSHKKEEMVKCKVEVYLPNTYPVQLFVNIMLDTFPYDLFQAAFVYKDKHGDVRTIKNISWSSLPDIRYSYEYYSQEFLDVVKNDVFPENLADSKNYVPKIIAIVILRFEDFLLRIIESIESATFLKERQIKVIVIVLSGLISTGRREATMQVFGNSSGIVFRTAKDTLGCRYFQDIVWRYVCSDDVL